MKKIININLNGRVIPIEDSAYEKLQAYIESLRRYFSKEESRDEIINDIESRVAELLHEKVRKGAACVIDADIDEVAASMGRPEDFDAEETLENNSFSSQQKQDNTDTEKKPSGKKGRLYRDSNDKFIGGVCSGIAVYLNVDPTIVRLLFAIITFGGFGLGFLAYIILWIILPPKNLEGSLGKKLYRNPDDRVIAGVSGGLSAYFNIKSTIVRLVFAGPFLISLFFSLLNNFRWHSGFDVFPSVVFGSLTGTFILAYVVLWIVLPEAHSPYEKMEMRGEKVDVNSIRQNVKEGAENFKDKVKDWTEEVKESAQNLGNKAKEFSNTKGKTFANEFGETARRTSGGLVHAIAVLFKAFFLFIAGTIAFGLFVALIALIFGGVAWWPVNDFLWTSNLQQIYAWATLLLFFAVPLIGFIIWVVRRVTRVKSRSNYLGWTFGFLWTLGWVAAALFATSLAKDFRTYEHSDTTIAINQTVKNKLIVAVSDPELEYRGRYNWMNDDSEGWDLSNDTLRLSIVQFNIKASKDSQYHVLLKKYSYGKSTQEALLRAEKTRYAVVNNDSILDLANGYAIDKNSKFRGQQVEVEIQVPIGKKLRFDESVNDKLNPRNVMIKRKSINDNTVEIDVSDSYWSLFRPGVDYVMGVDGYLKDPNGNIIKAVSTVGNSSYRYNGKIDTIQEVEKLNQRKLEQEEANHEIQEKIKQQRLEQEDMNREIEEKLKEQKRIIEDADREIRDLQKKINKKTTALEFRAKNHDKDIAASNSSISLANRSLINWF